MKIDAVSIRVGNILDHKNKLWSVLKIQHTQPGKGGAYIQVEMKTIKDATKLNERFRSGEKVELARLDESDFQYLYTEGNNLVLMDKKNYDQVMLPSEMLEDRISLLQDNMDITVSFYENQPISITLPENIILTVKETESVVKGQTAASSNKPANMENGMRVMVPSFVSNGDRVVIDSRDLSYVERAKN